MSKRAMMLVLMLGASIAGLLLASCRDDHSDMQQALKDLHIEVPPKPDPVPPDASARATGKDFAEFCSSLTDQCQVTSEACGACLEAGEPGNQAILGCAIKCGQSQQSCQDAASCLVKLIL